MGVGNRQENAIYWILLKLTYVRNWNNHNENNQKCPTQKKLRWCTTYR